MDPIRIALCAAVVPAATTAATLLLLARARGRAGGGTDVSLALVAGFIAGWIAVAGVPRLPPAESWQWLLPLAAAAAVVGAIDARASNPWLRRLPRAAAAFAVVWATVIDRDVLRLAGSTCAVIALVEAWEALAARTSRTTLAAVLLAASLGAAVAAALSWMILGLLCGAIAASAGACLVFGSRGGEPARDAAAPAGLLLGGLLLSAVAHEAMPATSALLFAAAPFAAYAAHTLVPRSARTRTKFLAATSAAAATAAGGVLVALAAAPPLDY